MNAALIAVPPVFWRVGQIGLTVLLFILLWRAADGPEILRSLQTANPLLLAAAVGALLSQTVLSAWRWKITAAELGQSLPLSHAIREYFMSQVINQALPGGVVGDATRAVRARSEVGLATSGLAVGLERLAGQIAMFVTLACAFVVTYLWDGGLDWPPRYAASIGGTIALVSLAILAGGALGGSITLSGRPVARWLEMAKRALLSRRVLPAQIGLGIAITVCNLTAFGLCAWAVGAPLSAGPVFTIVPIVLFSMLIPLTVSGWGVREGAAAVLLPLAGIAAADAVAASVLFGVAMLLAVLPSFVIMVSR